MGLFGDKPDDLTRAYTELIRAAGATVKRIVRILPPLDTGGDVEVLFLADDDEPTTAYIATDDTERVLLASGW